MCVTSCCFANPQAPEPRLVPGARSLAALLDEPASWYAGAEATAIAETVLLYQRSAGGWPKNVDMTRPTTPALRAGLEDERELNDATIDNGATYTQIRFLASIEQARSDARVRRAVIAGLDYLLTAQYPNGGWPQYFPLRTNYSRNITYNDGAMVGVIRLLRDVGAGTPPFAFVDETRRGRARDAVARGLSVILTSQVTANGTKTVWCAQHDPLTLAPVGARAYEHPSLSGSESVAIVELLMEVPNPDARVVEAIERAVAWFRAVQLEGVRVQWRRLSDAPRDVDVVVVADPSAAPLWARFYEIGTNRPIFSGRDGVVKYSLAEIERERRTGYSWYGEYAAALLATRYPAWRARR